MQFENNTFSANDLVLILRSGSDKEKAIQNYLVGGSPHCLIRPLVQVAGFQGGRLVLSLPHPRVKVGNWLRAETP